MRVLVVEDGKKVARALRQGLEAEHYDVRVASSGEEGFFLVNHEAFDCSSFVRSRPPPPLTCNVTGSSFPLTIPTASKPTLCS
jgi:CheY-like chemotaxis protein